MKRRSVRRRRPRLRGWQRKGQQEVSDNKAARRSERAGFSRDVNRAGRGKQSCSRLWVHTFRALRVEPAVLGSGVGEAGYLVVVGGSEEKRRGVAGNVAVVGLAAGTQLEDMSHPVGVFSPAQDARLCLRVVWPMFTS